MTENQKKRITRLRQQGFGYAISIRTDRKTPAGDEPCRSFVFYASFLRAKIICHTMVNKA